VSNVRLLRGMRLVGRAFRGLAVGGGLLICSILVIEMALQLFIARLHFLSTVNGEFSARQRPIVAAGGFVEPNLMFVFPWLS